MVTPSWPAAPLSPRLEADEVHVWCAALDRPEEQVAALRCLLSPDEQARADRFRVARALTEFTVARGLIRTILAPYLGVAPEIIRFATAGQGKPVLASAALHFNVSHSHGLALFAVTALGEVGVDVELVRPRINYLELAARFYAPAEAATLRGLPPDMSLQGFFNAWTRKEAFLKATGLGLSYGSERVEVTLLPGDEARVLCIDGATLPARSWSLAALAPAPGYVGALAIQTLGTRLRCWAWPG